MYVHVNKDLFAYVCSYSSAVISQGFFPEFWEYDPYPGDWEFQRCFVKIWEEMHDCNFTID